MRRIEQQKGFTIVEVLVSLMIIGLAATATATGMRATTNHLGSSELQARGIALTQEAVEDLRTLSYDTMQAGSTTTTDGFRTAWTVEADNPEPMMKLITATTTWNWRGEEQTYTIHTVYSQVTPN